MSSGPVMLDGDSLTCARVAAAARGQAPVAIDPAGRERARAAARTAAEVTAQRPVYGRTTGVGANRDQPVAMADEQAGLRLMRSHAGGGGPLVAPELSRAMLVIRANQIAAGGAGVDPGVLDVLADGLNRGLSAPVPVYGAIGTGDLTAMAEAALCLIGERDWRPPGPGQPRFPLGSADALAFMSSSAATLGEACLACDDLAGLLSVSTLIAAFSLLAVGGSMEPYAEAVHGGRRGGRFRAGQHRPGQQAVAARIRALLDGQPGPSARIQDPYGYRALPQVHGAAVDALAHAERTVTTDINAADENPLVDVAGQAVWHNGNFHTAYLGLALDAVRAALFQTAALAAARLGTLVEPRFTGLTPFLAGDPQPSSGIMILEYVAHAAVADIRRLAAPAALGAAVLSRGVEDHAGFSTQAARATTDVLTPYRMVLAAELVAAVRALRMAQVRPAGAELADALALAAGALPPGTEDRPLDDDLAAALDLLPRLAGA